MGLSYWVELIGKGGQKQRVTTERTFRSGERIRLRVVSNRDGYLYLANIGSTGRSAVLFPHRSVGGGSSFVKASTPYEIPYSASIRFDENPGVETLLLILSTKPLDGTALAGGQTRPLTIEETRRVTALTQQKGAKDLVLELDSESPEPASYAAAPLASLEGGQMITLQIKLRHE
jgi:hypothetical protein